MQWSRCSIHSSVYIRWFWWWNRETTKMFDVIFWMIFPTGAIEKCWQCTPVGWMRKKIKRWRSMMSRPGGCVENLLPAYTGRRWGAWGTLCPAQATTPDSLNHAFLGRLVISRGKVNIMTLRSRQHPTGWILYKCCCLVICSYLFSEQLVRYLLVYSRLTYNPNSWMTEYTH